MVARIRIESGHWAEIEPPVKRCQSGACPIYARKTFNYRKAQHAAKPAAENAKRTETKTMILFISKSS